MKSLLRFLCAFLAAFMASAAGIVALIYSQSHLNILPIETPNGQAAGLYSLSPVILLAFIALYLIVRYGIVQFISRKAPGLMHLFSVISWMIFGALAYIFVQTMGWEGAPVNGYEAPALYRLDATLFLFLLFFLLTGAGAYRYFFTGIKKKLEEARP